MFGLGLKISQLLNIISSIIGGLRFNWEDMQQAYWENQTTKWEEWYSMSSPYAFGNINTKWESLTTNWEDMVGLPFWEATHTNWESLTTNWENIT